MKKIAAFLCAVLLLPVLLTSCGSSSSNESRVEVTRGGKITEYAIEDFSASNYDLDELKEFIDEEVKAFKEENKGRIRVKKEKVRKDTAYLTIRYNKPETYAAFNDVVCFSGTIGEALEEGYDFSDKYILATEESKVSLDEETYDGEEAAEEIIEQVYVSGSTVIVDESMKVLIIETDMSVKVPGKVQYYRATRGDAQLESEDFVSVYVSEDLVGEPNVVYVFYE